MEKQGGFFGFFENANWQVIIPPSSLHGRLLSITTDSCSTQRSHSSSTSQHLVSSTIGKQSKGIRVYSVRRVFLTVCLTCISYDPEHTLVFRHVRLSSVRMDNKHRGCRPSLALRFRAERRLRVPSRVSSTHVTHNRLNLIIRLIPAHGECLLFFASCASFIK